MKLTVLCNLARVAKPVAEKRRLASAGVGVSQDAPGDAAKPLPQSRIDELWRDMSMAARRDMPATRRASNTLLSAAHRAFMAGTHCIVPLTEMKYQINNSLLSSETHALRAQVSHAFEGLTRVSPALPAGCSRTPGKVRMLFLLGSTREPSFPVGCSRAPGKARMLF